MGLYFSEMRHGTLTFYICDKVHKYQQFDFLPGSLNNDAFPVIMLALRLPHVTRNGACRADPQALEIGC